MPSPSPSRSPWSASQDPSGESRYSCEDIDWQSNGLYAYGGIIELTDTLVSDNGWRGARLRQGGTVECHGQVGVEAGFLRNARGVAVIDTNPANRLISDVCDFGYPNPDWEIFLDGGPRYAYGDDATFVCTSLECL